MTIARHVRITGQVQGVFFRVWTREGAEELRVTGWVRNCRDGSVEAHLEGKEGPVQELIDRMRRGPPGARVENLEATDTELEQLQRFEVRR